MAIDASNTQVYIHDLCIYVNMTFILVSLCNDLYFKGPISSRDIQLKKSSMGSLVKLLSDKTVKTNIMKGREQLYNCINSTLMIFKDKQKYKNTLY